MPPTSICWVPRRSRTASATTTRMCRWPRSTTPSGSTARSVPTTGCCTRWTAPARRIRAAWPAASSSPATACWWPAPRRKA
ncbi:hypothetical protein G6F35_018908 [Rhizopus arrhizus]|nr:hypothetical protein G6F35_018908 [Rhizopus arrhizus]KAG1218250.1 hypothetical protein G6F68_021620 [Rhizopus microsporus]